MSDETYDSPVLRAAEYVERVVKRHERFGDAHPATIDGIERAIERFEDEIRPMMREVDATAAGEINHEQLRSIVTMRMELKRIYEAKPHPLLKSALDEISAWIEG